MPKKQTQVFAQPSLRRSTVWTPALIRQAEQRADTGDLSLAAELCEQMMGDERFQGVASSRSGGLLSKPIEFEKGGDKRRAGRAVKALDAQEDWWAAFPENELASFLEWGLNLGVGLAQKKWVSREEDGINRVVPQLETWSPRHLRWSWKGRRWEVQVLRSGSDKPEWIPLDPVQFILYLPYGSTRPWARGLWRGCARWWLLKQFAVVDWPLYSERHGGGFFLGIGSEGASDEDRKALAADIDELEANASISIPHGYDVKIVESTSDTYETFCKQIEYADNGFTIAWLGANLTTEVDGKGGTNAAAKTQASGPILERTRRDAETLSTCIHYGALVEWADLNFGDRKLAPWPVWQVEPKESLKLKADTLKALGEALALLKAQGIDIEPLLEEYGLELLPESEQPKPAPAPAPSPDPETPPIVDEEKPQEQLAEENGARSRVIDLGGKLLGRTRLRATPLAEGQVYTDAVGDHCERRGPDAFLPELVKVVAEIDAARDYDDLRGRLRKVLPDMDPDALASLTERALVMCELAGRLAVRREL